MATQTSPIVSVEEYLRSSYEPDCDYVDGEVEERAVGEWEHSKIQGMLVRILGNHEKEWSIDVAPECRVQVTSSRYRVPDVLAMRRGQKVKRIVLEAPLLCIEVLSPEDTWRRLKVKLDDYLALGVKSIWVLDPDDREAYTYDNSGYHRVIEGVLTVEGSPIRVLVADIFAGLDA